MTSVNDLQDQIEVWKYVKTDNEGGTPIENYAFYRKKFAQVKVLGGSTENSGIGNSPYTNVEFTIRHDEEIDYACQIRYEGTNYKIQHIQVIGREAWMKLTTNVYNESPF